MLGVNSVTAALEITNDMLRIFPGVNTANEIAKALNNYIAANDTQAQLNKNKNLYDELNSRAELRNLDALETYLPVLFAQDVFHWAGGDKKFVVDLDSCEVLGGGKKLNANSLPCYWWLIGEGGLIRQMPATLWLAASRNKLPWLGAEIITRIFRNLSAVERTMLQRLCALEK